MEPQRRPDGVAELDPARSPTAVDVATPLGVVVSEPPRLGAWDVWTDADLQADTGPTPARRKAKASTDSGSLRTAYSVPPASSEIRASTRDRLRRTQQALALRASGYGVNEIAASMGVSAATITGWFVAHRRAVSLDEIDAMLDAVALPLAAENLVHGLLAGDKDYTLETLKGRGRFRKHSEGDGKPPATLPELRISFEVPTADQMAGRDGVPAGVTIGRPQEPRRIGSASTTPGTIDGETVGVLSSPHADPAPTPDAPAGDPTTPVAVGRPLTG